MWTSFSALAALIILEFDLFLYYLVIDFYACSPLCTGPVFSLSRFGLLSGEGKEDIEPKRGSSGIFIAVGYVLLDLGDWPTCIGYLRAIIPRTFISFRRFRVQCQNQTMPLGAVLSAKG